MSVDISRHPNDIFADLISQRNPSLAGLTKDDITIRRITDLNAINYLPALTITTHKRLVNYPDVLGIMANDATNLDYIWYVVRKWVYFNGNDVTINAKGDDVTTVYIDGVKILYIVGTLEEPVVTIPLTEGYHDVLVTVRESGGKTYVAMHMTDGTNSYETDDSWLSAIDDGVYPAFDLSKYISNTLKTSVEVDLVGGKSEVYGDFVKFNYGRIPIYSLFEFKDTDPATNLVEVNYPLDNISMLSSAINNFADIYDSWYRFSHLSNASNPRAYPAKAAELNGWSHIAEYDCIQSTENSTTFVGFISDDFATDYEFSTLVTAEHSDDDVIAIIMAGFKQNDIDGNEHTLTLSLSRGGFNGSYIRVDEDLYQLSKVNHLIIDPNTAAKANNGIGWKPYYAHSYIKRTGAILDIYVKMELLPVDTSRTRDQIILSLVDDASTLTPTAMLAAGYMHATIDLAVTAPKFNRPVRYGYGQYSQTLSRFWNIRRPNDNAELTPELKQYFLSNYGWNIGDTGVEVENIGANKFMVTFDNAVYKGALELRPS